MNYLVLRWLDRREWAWVTIPTLIAVFTVGAFGFGNALRGSDVILHEIAIVRGAPGTDRGPRLVVHRGLLAHAGHVPAAGRRAAP